MKIITPQSLVFWTSLYLVSAGFAADSYDLSLRPKEGQKLVSTVSMKVEEDGDDPRYAFSLTQTETYERNPNTKDVTTTIKVTDCKYDNGDKEEPSEYKVDYQNGFTRLLREVFANTDEDSPGMSYNALWFLMTVQVNSVPDKLEVGAKWSSKIPYWEFFSKSEEEKELLEPDKKYLDEIAENEPTGETKYEFVKIEKVGEREAAKISVEGVSEEDETKTSFKGSIWIETSTGLTVKRDVDVKESGEYGNATYSWKTVEK